VAGGQSARALAFAALSAASFCVSLAITLRLAKRIPSARRNSIGNEKTYHDDRSAIGGPIELACAAPSGGAFADTS
jgi:hypothetical protein